MKQGRVQVDAHVGDAIDEYLAVDGAKDAHIQWTSENEFRLEELRFISGQILNENGRVASTIDNREGFTISLNYEVLKPLTGLRIGFALQNSHGVLLCGSNDPDAWIEPQREPGYYNSQCKFPGSILNEGHYSVSFGSDMPIKSLLFTPFCLSFNVEDLEGYGPRHEKLPGIIKPQLEWEVSRSLERVFKSP
jgi:lipopolysaccharide transport system ATP-binding protein